MKIISFKTSANSGDIIYYLSGIKAVCEKNNAVADIFIWIDRPAFYYNNAVSPIRDNSGNMVSINHYMFKMIKPLLEYQPYINSVQEWKGEKVIVDLNDIYQKRINQPLGDIRKWVGYVFPDMRCDIAEPALVLPDHEFKIDGIGDDPYILFNRTERYNNPLISYYFLKYFKNVFFVGAPKEHNLIKKQIPDIKFLQPDNFLELASLIKGAKIFIGNQSMCFAIAEQIKSTRILEVCAEFPNVITCGDNAYEFYDQKALEYYVEKLWKGEYP